MKTDEIFRSMKAQMEPSDQVVEELLSLIASEKTSSNVVSFAQEKAKRKKPLWYYGTAVAASVVVLVSTFAMLDTGDSDSGASTIKSIFENITDGSGSVYQRAQSGTEADSSVIENITSNDVDLLEKLLGIDLSSIVGSDSSATDEDMLSEDGDDALFSELDNLLDEADGSEAIADDSDQYISMSYTGDSESGINDAVTGTYESSVRLSKITPGSFGVGEISWTSEILNSSEMTSLSLYGNTYTFEGTASYSEIGTQIKSITINLPESSTTNATTLLATVYTVSDISSSVMVALDVVGFDKPLIYVNSNYSPSTLGEFISDIGLADSTTFATAVVGQTTIDGATVQLSYTKKLDSAVWNYLLGDSSSGVGSYSSYNAGTTKLAFASYSNPTGSQIQFGVSSNGYLCVLLSTGQEFTFQIGSSNAKAFIEYVTEQSVMPSGVLMSASAESDSVSEDS